MRFKTPKHFTFLDFTLRLSVHHQHPSSKRKKKKAFVATYALKINIDGDPDPMALPNSGDTKSDGEADDADVDSNSAQGNDSASGGGNSAAAAEDAPAVAVKVSKSEKVEKSGSWYMPTKGPIADAISYVWPSSKVEKKKKGDDAGENKAQEGASSPHEQQLVAASSDTDGDQIDLQQDAAATKVQEVAVASKAEAEAEAEAEDEEGEEDGTPFETWALRGGMCFVATGISIAMLSFGVIVPRRYTHTMTILKDAKTVRIGTYQLIGERSFEVPITALKFQHKNVPDPLSKISTYEIDGTKGFHLMDSKAGFFPDTRLFHWVLYRTQN